MKNKTDQIDSPASGYDRRGFLRRLLVGAGLAGLGASLAAGACRCEDDDTEWSDDSESRGGATVSPPDDKSDQATDKSGSGEGSGETGGSSTEGSTEGSGT